MSDPTLEFHWYAVMNMGECALRVIWESDQRYSDIPVKSRNESERGILHEQKQRTLRRNRGWWQETRCGTRAEMPIFVFVSSPSTLRLSLDLDLWILVTAIAGRILGFCVRFLVSRCHPRPDSYSTNGGSSFGFQFPKPSGRARFKILLLRASSWDSSAYAASKTCGNVY